ncbi:MAG TPA: hypothetical protein VGW78_02305 [Candidatus Babeliales bacterium]|jgi:hypothetical protein|nr:hypothetical protein [Candidatus Babeliales bacterium]
MTGNKRNFAEVIESSLQQCIAQVWQWNNSPSFGSLVVIHDDQYPLIGVVHQIRIGSSDPGRIPFAYQKTPEELQSEQPHIFNFLKTTVSILILGYIEKKVITYTIAPRPAPIHAFVQLAPPDILTQFFSEIDFMHCLFGIHSSISGIDELLCAMLHVYLHYLNKMTIRDILYAYMLLIGGDYKRIRILARRITSLTLMQ